MRFSHSNKVIIELGELELPCILKQFDLSVRTNKLKPPHVTNREVIIINLNNDDWPLFTRSIIWFRTVEPFRTSNLSSHLRI